MDDLGRHFAKMRNIVIFAIVAQLAIVGGLIWLGVYAINAFSG
jgi:hypothetical protein